MSLSSTLWHRLALGASSSRKSYALSLAASITERDAEEWHAACGGRADAVMDPRFLKAVEKSMAAEARFHNVIFRDSAGEPAGAAFLSFYTVDGLLLSTQRWKKLGTQVRKLWPNFLKIPVLFCGCPVSTGESHLRFATRADHVTMLRQLDRLLVLLAWRNRTPAIVFKDFGPQEIARTDALLDLGYVRAESLPMNYFPARFRNFDHFCDSLRSRYRRKIVRSRRKLQRAGLRVVHLRGGMGFHELYTDDVHRLYLAVLSRAPIQFECLPAQFFRELARQLPEDSAFTLICQGERVVGFTCGLFHQGAYHNFFCGFDYELNAEAELYFNLLYEDLDYALQQNVHSIQIGQTADEYKMRVGCYREPRYFYVKVREPGLQLLLRAAGSSLFPPAPGVNDRNLFRQADEDDFSSEPEA
jgi:predicted N-acyltransferase